MKIALIVGAILVLLLLAAAFVVLRRSSDARSSAVILTAEQKTLRDELRGEIAALCAHGPRTIWDLASLAAARDRIVRELAGYPLERHRYVVEGIEVENVIAELRGATIPDEIVILAAHYDSVDESPGADDNATGVAALLAIARRMREAKPDRTVRFVAFVNEEPPFFKTSDMGSWRYAKRCRERGETIVAMLSLEMLGYYDTTPGSQQYPPPLASLYPRTGDFIGFAGNLGSRGLVGDCVRAFEARNGFPAESAVLPEMIEEIGWSDQWSFWQFDYPGIMVTDTALYRNPHYHTAGDVPSTLDYDRMAVVVDGLVGVVEELAR